MEVQLTPTPATYYSTLSESEKTFEILNCESRYIGNEGNIGNLFKIQSKKMISISTVCSLATNLKCYPTP